MQTTSHKDSQQLLQHAVDKTGLTANDLVHVAVIDENGFWTGQAGNILETYDSRSKIIDAKDTQGANIYYRDAVKDNSLTFSGDHLKDKAGFPQVVRIGVSRLLMVLLSHLLIKTSTVVLLVVFTQHRLATITSQMDTNYSKILKSSICRSFWRSPNWQPSQIYWHNGASKKGCRGVFSPPKALLTGDELLERVTNKLQIFVPIEMVRTLHRKVHWKLHHR